MTQQRLEAKTEADRPADSQPQQGVWSDFLQSAGYFGVQMPYDGVQQIANSVGIGLPNAELVAAPKHADLGSANWFAQQAGAGLGMIPTFMVTHGGVKSVLKAGSATQLAVSGGLYSGVFVPTQSESNLLTDRLANAATGAASFYAMGKVGSMLSPTMSMTASDGLASAIRHNVAQRLQGGAIGLASGAAGGFVNAESNSLLKTGKLASGTEVGEAVATYAVMGFGVGALSRGFGRKQSEVRQRAMEEGNFDWHKIEGVSEPIARQMSSEAQASFSQGKTLARQSQHQQAVTAFENAGKHWAEALGPEHPNVAQALGEIAYQEMRLGNNAKALKAAHKALSIEQSAFGEKSVEVAHRYEQVSGIEQASKNFGSAAQHLEYSLDIWKQLSREGALHAAQNEAFIAGGHRSMASRLATLLDAAGQTDKAAAVRSNLPEIPQKPITLMEKTSS